MGRSLPGGAGGERALFPYSPVLAAPLPWPTQPGTWVKHWRHTFPLVGPFRNVPRLIASRVVAPSGSAALSGHARCPPRVRSSVGGPRRACPGQDGLSAWWPRPWALAPGRPSLASDPKQGWAFATLSARRFITAPTLGVDECRAPKMDLAAVGVALGVGASGGWEDVCPAPLLHFTEYSLCARPGTLPLPPGLSRPNRQPSRPQQLLTACALAVLCPGCPLQAAGARALTAFSWDRGAVPRLGRLVRPPAIPEPCLTSEQSPSGPTVTV